MKGLVSLVGAGPGDPDLLTIKAAKRLRDADLVIYDYLVNPEHLRHSRDSAAKICVGKDFRHRLISQDKINRLIAREAKRGRRVVRLKGGDPYLFGRGGEEALLLRKQGIPFEVISGVTSATACGAYAGIPLTHRDHNAAVTFLTGHRANDENLDSIYWEKIVALGGTIVIYMGFYNLGRIAERLVEAGMSAQTRVAVIEWGTLPRQRSCEGTLANIKKIADSRGLKAPSIIIIGDVVGLRGQLNWFENLPLFGKTVVVTRMKERSGVLREKLGELGAEALELPVIEIHPAKNFSPIDSAIRRLDEFDWVVFTSQHGVEAFFDRLRKLRKDGRAFGHSRIASVGPETTRALRCRGVGADLEPARFETEALVEAFKKKYGSLKGKKFLLLRTDIAPPALEQGLAKLGARVNRVTAYRTRRPKTVPAPIKRRILEGRIDAVTFTSASTVTHFIGLLGLKNARRLARRVKFASIGPVTSRALRSFGLKAD